MSENMGEKNSYDLVIIGGGPAGYTGAIRAAQLGFKVAIIEKDKTLGGTCLNVGCIPSKALLDSSEHFLAAQHEFASHGIKVGKVELDLPTMLARKDKVVKDLTSGIDFLMKKNKITRINGKGKLLSTNTVQVTASEGTQTVLEAKNIILSTGSTPIELPFMKFDYKNIVSSTEALAFEKVPEHLVVVGGGVIGLEMSSVWSRLGSKVTVIEFSDHIAGASDLQMCNELTKILKKQNMEFLLSCKVTGAKISGSKITVLFEDMKNGGTKEVVCDKVLVAVGRRPYSEGLGLEEVGVQKDNRGCVVINDHFQTNIPNIYAVGDLVRGPMLAHKAEEEGVAVAEILAGQAGHVNYLTVPNVIYTWPELASVGYTEEQLKTDGVEYNVGTFPFKANGRARAMAMQEGLVKILADKKSDKILGVHILGPRASDIISECVVAMEFSASSEDLARSFHAHPTLPEAIREAALAVNKLTRQM